MNSKYYLAAIVAFTIWGLFSLPLRALAEFSSMEILLYRVFFSATFILIISCFVRWKTTLQNVKLFKSLTFTNRKNILIVNIISALLLALNWYLFIYVMNRISVNATSLAYLVCPILTTLLAAVFLKEKLSKLQWTAVGMSLFSCLLLSVGHFIDLLYSMVIALSYAIYLVLQKKNNQLDKFFTLTAQIVLGSLLILPMYPMVELSNYKGLYFYSLVILIAVLFTIIPMYFNVLALKRLNSSVVGIFIYINPILSFTLAVFYFKENISWVQSFAYGIIFCSLWIFNWNAIKSASKSNILKKQQP